MLTPGKGEFVFVLQTCKETKDSIWTEMFSTLDYCLRECRVYDELSAPVNNPREAESCNRRLSDQLTANYILSLTYSNCFFSSSWKYMGKREKMCGG